MKHSGLRWKRRLFRYFVMRDVDIRCGWLGALVMLTVSILIRLLAGSPYRVYYLLRGSRLLPSLALLSLGNLLVTVAMGFACGLVLSCRRYRAQCVKYQSGMLFVLLSIFWFITYPLIFRGCLLFAAILSLCVVLFLGALCTVLFFRVQTVSGWIGLVFLLWCVWLLGVLLGSIFLI